MAYPAAQQLVKLLAFRLARLVLLARKARLARRVQLGLLVRRAVKAVRVFRVKKVMQVPLVQPVLQDLLELHLLFPVQLDLLGRLAQRVLPLQLQALLALPALLVRLPR